VALLEKGQQGLLLAPQILNFCFHFSEALAENLLMRLVAVPCQQLADVAYRHTIGPEIDDLLQALNLDVAIPAVAICGAARGFEQTFALIIKNRGTRQTKPFSQLADC